ncbi:hypothetical protein FOA52_007808 [Chlamydomonas sp. UWO 241]|nr:hypothetical protein FOA52_007808 [Chlamydomonas sp. UWO 241]
MATRANQVFKVRQATKVLVELQAGDQGGSDNGGLVPLLRTQQKDEVIPMSTEQHVAAVEAALAAWAGPKNEPARKMLQEAIENAVQPGIKEGDPGIMQCVDYFVEKRGCDVVVVIRDEGLLLHFQQYARIWNGRHSGRLSVISHRVAGDRSEGESSAVAPQRRGPQEPGHAAVPSEPSE